METEAHGLLSMPGVGFFGMLIIGVLAGYIAEKVTASDQRPTSSARNPAARSGHPYDGRLAIFVVVGAILLLWVWRRFRETA